MRGSPASSTTGAPSGCCSRLSRSLSDMSYSLPVAAISVVVDPPVVDPVHGHRSRRTQLPKPVLIVNKQIGRAAGTMVVAGLKAIHLSQVPLNHPIRYPAAI